MLGDVAKELPKDQELNDLIDVAFITS